MSVTYFLSENSVKASRMIYYYLWIQHQNPSAYSSIRHYDAFQDTWNFPKLDILQSQCSKKKKGKKMFLTGSDENDPFNNQVQRMSCITKTNTDVYYSISRWSRIMDTQDGGNYAKGTPESQHLIYLPIIGCKAQNRFKGLEER